MATNSDWMDVLEGYKPSNHVLVHDSPEKQEILKLLNDIIARYNRINGLLKVTSKKEPVIKSRAIYGAVRKDVGSALYHANLQIKWVTTEKD